MRLYNKVEVTNQLFYDLFGWVLPCKNKFLISKYSQLY